MKIQALKVVTVIRVDWPGLQCGGSGRSGRSIRRLRTKIDGLLRLWCLALSAHRKPGQGPACSQRRGLLYNQMLEPTGFRRCFYVERFVRMSKAPRLRRNMEHALFQATDGSFYLAHPRQSVNPFPKFGPDPCQASTVIHISTKRCSL